MCEDVEKLAEDHVEWLLETLLAVAKPLMITEFIHGYKHGVESIKEDEEGII